MKITLSDVEVRLPPDSRCLFRISRFTVEAGSKVLLYGRSGAGKTTLLHLIAGLFLADSGSVQLGDRTLSTLSDAERSLLRRTRLGLIFQRLNLIDHLNSLENVLLSMHNRPGAGALALEALERVHLAPQARQRVATLSLGEQQRVAVARVLASEPELILADEPTSSLDESNAASVLDSLLEASHGKTLLVVSHDRRIRERFGRTIDFEEMVSR